MMNRYMVVARIGSTDYMTTVTAESSGGAEHVILDMGVCGRHEYGVLGAFAFDAKGMKTDAFIGMALKASPVSLEEITHIIDERNSRIKAKDEAEDRIREIEKQMNRLTAELEEAKKVLAA